MESWGEWKWEFKSGGKSGGGAGYGFPKGQEH